MSNNRNSARNLELFEKLVYVGRCTKVVKGGRRFRFSAIVVVGDKRGRVGIGLGKAAEVVDAKLKASYFARKNMRKINLRNGRTLHYDVQYKHCSGMIVMKAAPPGTGIIAGGPVRSLMEVLGIQDVVAKSVGSSNPHNMLNAALEGLISINAPRFIADKRSKRVADLLGFKKKKVSEQKDEESSSVVVDKAATDKTAAANDPAANV